MNYKCVHLLFVVACLINLAFTFRVSSRQKNTHQTKYGVSSAPTIKEGSLDTIFEKESEINKISQEGEEKKDPQKEVQSGKMVLQDVDELDIVEDKKKLVDSNKPVSDKPAPVLPAEGVKSVEQKSEENPPPVEPSAEVSDVQKVVEAKTNKEQDKNKVVVQADVHKEPSRENTPRVVPDVQKAAPEQGSDKEKDKNKENAGNFENPEIAHDATVFHKPEYEEREVLLRSKEKEEEEFVTPPE
eukprot:Platyproteum_vivax@DN10057_c0_g1_i1.p1